MILFILSEGLAILKMQSSIERYMNTKDNSKTTDMDATTEQNTLSPSRTAEKRNRSNSDPAPSGLRLSPVSKKIVYDGEDEVYKFDAPLQRGLLCFSRRLKR